MVASLLSGILLAAPFLVPSLFWLHYGALVPWIWLLTRSRARGPALYFLIGAGAFLAMAFGPFSTLSKAVPWVAALALAPLMLPFAILVRHAGLDGRIPGLVLVPVAWVTSEWIRLRFSVGQVGLFPLGASQYQLTPLLQIADVTGAAGVSFVVAAANGLLSDLWLRRRPGRKGLVAPLASFGVLLAVVLAYGGYRLSSIESGPGPRIAVVQPDEAHYRDPSRVRALFDAQVDFTRAEIRPGVADLVAWPENAIDYPFEEDPYFAETLGALARHQDAAILAGAFHWASKSRKTLHTSGYYLTRDGRFGGRYDKIYLIPWAEYLPFESWLPGLSGRLHRWHLAAAQRVLGYLAPGVAGEDLVLFSLSASGETFRFATPICYEIGNPAFGRRACAAGADFLVNISSEGFFGAPLYRQMWALSTLRAVETRLAVVRVGNHGISGFIDPSGRARSVLRGNETGRPYLEPGTLVDRVSVAARPGSFYARHGDLFSYLCAAVSCALLAASLLARRRARLSKARATSRRPAPKR